MTTRSLRFGISLMLAATFALSACSGGDDDSDAADPTTTSAAADSPVTTTSDASADASDSSAICAIFSELAANREERGGQAEPTTAEGWEIRLQLTREIADAAPKEWRDEAETYVQMVEDRAELAAENGYVAVNELPEDVRDAFIAEHREMQAEVEDLIEFMDSECGAT